MRTLGVFLLVATIACEPAKEVVTDTREAIGVYYVGAPDLKVHAKPADDAPVVTRYLNGESVSVLAKNGEWAEVRTSGGSGWARMTDLVTANAAAEQQENPTARFRIPPAPVTVQAASGEINIEASVNTDGDVTSVRILGNTTGSEELAAKNAAALQRAKFYPMVRKGDRKPFQYYYRVSY